MFACPTCREGLKSLKCEKCGTVFPELDSIPVIVPRPEASLAGWKNRWMGWRARLHQEAARVELGLRSEISDLTKKRLQKLQRAYSEQDVLVADILKPLYSAKPVEPLDEVIGGRLPFNLGLVSYESNLFRDWVWGQEENQASLECIHSLGVEKLGKTLVIGAGWGRLAYDVHQGLGSTDTTATDLNPFCLLVAKQLAAGQTIRLQEFPIAPQTLEQVSILRELKAPKVAGKGLQFVMSDCLAPAFADATFDTIITPWLIDVIRDDFRSFSARVNAMLKPGGQWVEFGSLAFTRSNPALNYSKDEILDLLKTGGFEVSKSAEPVIPYLKSPDSRHSRVEKVWAFRAVKMKSVPMPAVARFVPEWLEKPDTPIPQKPELTAALVANGLYAEILKLIDGKRTVQDLAAHLTQKYSLDAPRAVEAVTHFLSAQVEHAEASNLN